jgi:hypothetical protein
MACFGASCVRQVLQNDLSRVVTVVIGLVP